MLRGRVCGHGCTLLLHFSMGESYVRLATDSTGEIDAGEYRPGVASSEVTDCEKDRMTLCLHEASS